MSIIYSIFGFILQLCYKLCSNNFIIALVLFTLIAKLLMLPMGISQQKSAVKMQRMKPEMEAIKKKYGTNQQKYSEELQKLYQKYDYKMSAGCLPMLIQFPIIIGLFGVIYYPMTYILGSKAAEVIATAQRALENPELLKLGERAQGLVETVANTAAADYVASSTARGAEIAIAQTEGLMNFKLFGIIDLAATPTLAEFSWLWLIPLAAGLSAMLSGYISSKLNGQELNGMTRGMIFGMPIMSVVIAFSLPATIGFYWTISSILQIGQSFLVKKLYSPEREERKQAARREKERAEKLDRLRRLHGDDDDVPGNAEKIGQESGKKVIEERPRLKDDPADREDDGKKASEEKPELTKKQQKELNRQRLRDSRKDNR